MRKPDLYYVYRLEYRSCAPNGGWVERAGSRWEFSVTTNRSVYELATQIALRSFNVTETGVRITFLGTLDKAWANSEITPMSPFVLTLERA